MNHDEVQRKLAEIRELIDKLSNPKQIDILHGLMELIENIRLSALRCLDQGDDFLINFTSKKVGHDPFTANFYIVHTDNKDEANALFQAHLDNFDKMIKSTTKNKIDDEDAKKDFVVGQTEKKDDGTFTMKFIK